MVRAGEGVVLATNASGTGPLSPDWLPAWVPNWLPPIVATIVVFVAAWLIARLLTHLLGRRLARRFRRPSLTRTALRGIRVGVYLLALLIALRLNGMNLGNIALSVTVFTAVLGVILAPIVGSFISGVFLLADQPYEIGDMIELSDVDERGFVEDITLRYTKIFTLDNTFLVIPNGTIRERDVVNYSAEDPRTRRSIEVLITYESDLETAQRRLERAARRTDSVIEGGPDIRIGSARYPAAPAALVSEFADHGILLRLRFWVSEPYRLPTVLSAVRENVDDALADVDVEYAYPHTHHVFDDTSGQLRLSRSEPEEGDHVRATKRSAAEVPEEPGVEAESVDDARDDSDSPDSAPDG